MIISGVVILVMFLSVVRVIIANASVEASEKLKVLDKKINALAAENELRAEKLRVKESLSALSLKAEKSGFFKVGNYVIAEPKGPVAAVIK